ncbi:porin family protein [Muricauda sp. 2012CJ35-5]|uniref:Porin family protein n=1 Tax=Flagellimonas spongiicola TaxID=2942208 RepID=A0ABT0PP53_9FLAO|nr:outer membrane beta-barrel protein [Allomuricauda spongiicola]MCL6273170.1 porin family protein [Allomuricauda spongiicola]
MKKLVLFSLVLVFGAMSTYSQGRFQAGGHLGLPVGDAGDLATFAIAIDLAYILEIDDNISAGPRIGYSHSFGDEANIGGFTVDIEDVQFLPIGGRAQFDITDQFLARAELGYALGINDGNDGGFYWSPQAGYSITETIDLILSYRSVSLDGDSWDIVSLGVDFWFN